MDRTEQLFEVETDGNVMTVTFRAPFVNDTNNLEDFEDGLRELLADYEQRLLLLDFSQVDLVVSRMINSMLLLVKRVRAEGGQVHLCSLEPRVERVLKTMKLDRVFDMYDNRTEGLTAMKAVDAQFKMAQFA